MAKQETKLQSDIRLALASLPNVRLWRNNVGMATTDWGGKIHFGLAKGSADLIGIVTVGNLGLFLSVEVKSPRGKSSEEQIRWGNVITQSGGIHLTVRSPAEALSALQYHLQKIEDKP